MKQMVASLRFLNGIGSKKLFGISHHGLRKRSVGVFVLNQTGKPAFFSARSAATRLKIENKSTRQLILLAA
jgi:hypothetical protein